MLKILRSALPGPSTYSKAVSRVLVRPISSSTIRQDILSDLDKQLNPHEVIEAKRKAYEEKYGDKLRRRIEREGVRDLEALKTKVLAPSVRAALKGKKAREAIAEEAKVEKVAIEEPKVKAKATVDTRKEQGKGDRAGIKPLSSILNLPLIHLTPHDADQISKIWTTYHTSHPTLSSSFLSAHLPSSTYTSTLALARANPFFVLPLPKTATSDGTIPASYEMFFLQWLFHPTPTTSVPPSAEANPVPLPMTSSVIFTPLEEYKKQGEWAQPQLVLTHYPDLAGTHGVVLMRGEITPMAATGPAGSADNPGYLLSQSEAQLLALALQRFYCGGIAPPNETIKAKEEREKRVEALRGFREKPGEWSWEGLIQSAYGGMV